MTDLASFKRGFYGRTIGGTDQDSLATEAEFFLRLIASGLTISSAGVISFTVNPSLAAAAIASGILAVARGGTGLSTWPAGSIPYASALDTITALVKPSADRVLTHNATIPVWALIANANIDASAAIAYSKLNLATSIVNADVSASAAIAYSKLNLALGVVNGDISASAAIAFSKLATVTASKLLGAGSAGATTPAEISLGTGLSMSGTTLSSSVTAPEQWFRGLHLRTSPNADVAATTVTLQRCDAMTMDDGTYVESWDDLSAIITGSGAGGLDTGAEAASTWYEIYAIRKSSDGTKNLLLHRAKNYFLDESLTTESTSENVRNAAGNTKVGQTLDTDVTGLVEMIDVKLLKVSSPTGRMWVSIYATSAGAPTGAALATSDKLDVSLLSTTAQWVRFLFRTPYTFTAGTTYAVVVEGDWTIDGVNFIYWRSSNANPYAAGSRYAYDGSAWNVDAGTDQLVKVYVTENDASVTMPSGYDQKCLIGYVYNDSGSNFDAFFALDRRVNTQVSDVAAITATIGTLTSLVAFVPPVPVRVFPSFYADAANRRLALDSDFSMNSGNVGAFGTRDESAGTNTKGMWPIPLEYQGVYASVGAGTCTFQIPGWEW